MKAKILTGLCIVFGFGMIVFGANKFVPFMPMPELTEEQKAIFGAFGTIKWLMPLVGFIEILGGLLMAIPKTRALGAFVILPVVVGIITHLLTHEPSSVGIGLFFGAINVWAIIDNKDKYLPMIK
jgi:putative oxidoreductase